MNFIGKWLAAALVIWSCGAAESPWQVAELKQTPESWSADELHFDFPVPEGCRPIWLAGPEYQGQPTRIFAWLGIPQGAEGPLPAMLLVHGGGGTAFSYWVKYWTDRGYVALAVDTCGNRPLTAFEGADCRGRHENSPGPGDAPFSAVGAASERWLYHAVASVVLGNSFLRSLPEVDPERIGVTGISWGGVLTCIAAGLDDRFAVAIPVYGCGFLDEASWLTRSPFPEMPTVEVEEWIRLWDPKNYLADAAMPMLFVNDPTDAFFWQPSWVKSAALPQGRTALSDRLGFGHSHRQGMTPEVAHFADSILREEPGWPQLIEWSADAKEVRASWDPAAPPVAAELIYATGRGDDRKWLTAPAELEGTTTRAQLPESATAFFLNITDADGCVVSTPFTEVQP